MMVPLLCVRPHPVQPGDGVGVALHQPVLVSVAGVAPVSLPRARDESLVSHIFINNQSGLQSIGFQYHREN